MKSSGLSIIEIILAIALMLIIAAGAVVSLLGSFSSARLATQETQATNYCVEGLEATQSIRNQNWDNLSAGTHGLTSSGGTWAFSGTSDASGIFTRAITISTVARDNDGNIVSSGGTTDPNSFRASCSATWSPSPTRTNTVTLVTLLANWQRSRNTSTTRVIDTCAEFCQTQSYITGTCRPSPPTCATNSEIYKSAGDFYCTGGASADTCCCAP